MVLEQLRDPRMSVPASIRKWRSFPAVSRREWYIVVDKILDDVLVALRRCEMQWSSKVIVGACQRHSKCNHSLDGTEIALTRRINQFDSRRIFRESNLLWVLAFVGAPFWHLTALSANSSMLREDLRNTGMTVAKGVVQRRSTPTVLRIDLGAILNEVAHDRLSALSRREVHCRPAVIVGPVLVESTHDEAMNRPLIALAGGPDKFVDY
jgi:hypothetical protein